MYPNRDAQPQASRASHAYSWRHLPANGSRNHRFPGNTEVNGRASDWRNLQQKAMMYSMAELNAGPAADPQMQDRFGSPVYHSPKLAPQMAGYDRVPHGKSRISSALLQVLQLVEENTAQTFQPEEMELLYRLNSLMHFDCPRCSSPFYDQRPLAAREDIAGRSLEGARPCTLKDLKQLARSPLKYSRMMQANMVAEALLAIALSLCSSAQSYDGLLMMIAAHIAPLLNCDRCTLFTREDNYLLDLHGKKRHPLVGIVGFVAVTGSMFCADSNPEFQEKFDGSIDIPAAAYLCMPIHSADNVLLAVLRVVKLDSQAGPFSEDNQSVLEIVCSFLASCLQYLKVVHERDYALQKNQTMLQVAAALASAEYDSDKTCIQVLDFARTLCHADRCSLFLVDEALGELEAHFDDQRVTRMPLNQGIAGHVASTGEPVNISDAYSDGRFNRNMDAHTGYLTRSILCMPIQFEGKTVAVAQLVNKMDSGDVVAFTQRDVDNFLGFAGYAAISLRNMQMFQLANRECRRSESMLWMTYTLAGSTLDVQELAQRIQSFLKDVTHCDRCSLYITNDKKRMLEAFHQDGTVQLVSMSEGVAGHVVKTGETINIPDTSADRSAALLADPQMKQCAISLLCMPIMCGNSIVAVACMMNRMEGGRVVPFTIVDENSFMGFAVYAGVCIRTAVLYTQSIQQQAKADLLLDLTKTLQDRAVGQGEELVEVLMDRAQAMTGASRCAIFLVNEDTGHLQAPFRKQNDSQKSLDWNVARHVASSAQPVSIRHAKEERRFNSEEITDIQTLLSVPILYENQVVAVAQLVNKQNSQQAVVPFDQEDMDTLQLLCKYAALALRISRLYNKCDAEKKRSHTLLTMAHKLASTGLEERSMITLIMEQAAELGHCQTCHLHIISDDKIPGKSEKMFQCYLTPSHKVPMPTNIGVAGHIYETGKALIIPDVSKDPRFSDHLDIECGFKVKNVLGVPVKLHGDLLAILLLINKKQGLPFSQWDMDLLRSFAEFAAMALSNCWALSTISKQKQMASAQAGILGKFVATPIKDGVQIVENVMEGAKQLLQVDRCTVFVVDKERAELVSKVAQDVSTEIRVPWDQGIAGKVAQTGKVINISDCYQDPDFNRDVDVQFGYRTKSMLAMPIWHEGEVIGVTQVMNKKEGEVFNVDDEEKLASFSMYAGIALGNLRLYEFVVNASQAATDLLGLQQAPESGLGVRRRSIALFKKFRAVCEENVTRCVNLIVPQEIIEEAKSLHFNPLPWYKENDPNSDKGLTLIRILAGLFEDIGVVKEFGVDMRTLIAFLMQIRSMYRNVHYHNFAHAFDVTHFLYKLMLCIDEAAGLTMLDKFAMLVAGVVHDVDHMGLNNSFHLKCDTPMGILSSKTGTTSVLEVHHCSLAIQVLAVPSYNIFHNLDKDQMKYVYHLMVNVILATDMAHHAALTETFLDATRIGNVPKELLLKMLIKTADLSNTVKPFELAHAWAKCVTEEFFSQGDLEKQQGIEVMAMFDRTKSGELAKGQIGFIDFVARKHMETLATYHPNVRWLLDNVIDNRKKWEECLTK